MVFSEPLKPAILKKRYRRFLADVWIDGKLTTVYCPNTGSMLNQAEPESRVWLSHHAAKHRRYAYTWELTEMNGHFMGVNTHRANALVAEALLEHRIDELNRYSVIQQEVPYGEERSRVDFLLSSPSQKSCFLEVKSVTFMQDGVGYFPDAVTQRGQKHLRELMGMLRQGHEAVLFFCVQHTGVKWVAPAHHIDPAYGELLNAAVEAGLRVLAHGVEITPEAMSVGQVLPFFLERLQGPQI